MYYDSIHKKFRQSLMADCVQVYWSLGYTSYKDFPNEYFFMYNPTTLQKVRLYYAGSILEN
jgi:hypothetical protein